jgi:rubrerythrin
MKLLDFIEKGVLNEEDNRTTSYNAFGGESQAYMRYVHFTNQAKNEKLNNLARLFRAIANAEYICRRPFPGIKTSRGSICRK